MSQVRSRRSEEAVFLTRLLWVLSAATGGLGALSAAAAGLRFAHVGDFVWQFGGFLATLAAVRVYARLRGLDDERFVLCIDIAAAFGVTALGHVLLEYAAATTHAPDATAWVQAGDRALGFSWFDYAHYVSAVAPVCQALRFCYGNWMAELIAVMALLAFRRRYAAIGEFALAFSFTCLTTIGFFALVDSHSLEAAAAYSLPGFHHPGGTGPAVLAHLRGLRAGAERTLDFAEIWPLISFPSLHAATALLLAAATRELGPWRYPAFAFNVAIVIATIDEGGHNVSDVIAGGFVACAALAAAGAAHAKLRALALAAHDRWTPRHFPVDIPLAAER